MWRPNIPGLAKKTRTAENQPNEKKKGGQKGGDELAVDMLKSVWCLRGKAGNWAKRTGSKVPRSARRAWGSRSRRNH